MKLRVTIEEHKCQGRNETAEVSNLVLPDLKVEIEGEAVIFD